MSKPFEISSSTYTGTGAAQTVTLGFKPKFIQAFNQTDGDLAWFHIDGMTAATACSIDTEAAAEATAVTLTSTGFTLGTSVVVNENAKVYVYVAIGGN